MSFGDKLLPWWLIANAVLIGLLPALSVASYKLNDNKYKPYLTIGGARYFKQASRLAGIYDLFIPLWQRDEHILFTDLRVFNRSNNTFEGNAHIGYRKLYTDKNIMLGAYTAFDRKITVHDNSFNQLTFGLECWLDKFFIGYNAYQPIGKTQHRTQTITTEIKTASNKQTNVIKFTDTYYEKALPGMDLELGYAVTEHITGYAGGYYFAAKDTATVAGPKLRLTYDYQKPSGRILGILDGISIEAGAQHDKACGNAAYLGIRFKVGLTNLQKNSNISGFDRHMVESVRRDPDIITKDTQPDKKIEQTSYNSIPQDENNADDGQGDYFKNLKWRDVNNKPQREIYEAWLIEKISKKYAIPENIRANIDHLKTYIKDLWEKEQIKYAQLKDLAAKNTSDEYIANLLKTAEDAYQDLKDLNGIFMAEDFESSYKWTNEASIEDLNYYKAIAIKRLGLSQDISYQEAKKLCSDFINYHPDKHSTIDEKTKADKWHTKDHEFGAFKGLRDILHKLQKIENKAKQSRHETYHEVPINSQTAIPAADNTNVPIPNHKPVVKANKLHQINTGFGLPFLIKDVYALETSSSINTSSQELPPKQNLANPTCKLCALKTFIDQTNASLTDQLTKNQIADLEQTITENYTNKDLEDVLEPVATILTSYAIRYSDDEKHAAFVVDLASKQNIAVRTNIINTFANYVIQEKTQYNNERDSKIFDHFAQLLQYYDSNKLLVAALIDKAAKFKYTPSIAAFPYFEELLTKLGDNAEYRNKILPFMHDSLEHLISAANTQANFLKLEQYLDNLSNKTQVLPTKIMESVLASYTKDPNHFHKIIIDLLANDKQLPFETINQISAMLTKISDPKTALSIALLLNRHHFDLPVDVLDKFTDQLLDKDQTLSRLAINLYYQVASVKPEKISQTINAALLQALPTVSIAQQGKINAIIQHDFKPKPITNKIFSLRVDKQLSLLATMLPIYAEVFTRQASELLLNQLDWQETTLLKIITANPANITAVLLDKIIAYQLTPETIDRYGRTLVEIIPPKYTLDEVDHLIRDQNFHAAVNIQQLIPEFARQNQNNSRIQNLITNNYFTRQLLSIDAYLSPTRSVPINATSAKPLVNWTSTDFTLWSQAPPAITVDLNALMAITDVLTYDATLMPYLDNVAITLAVMSQGNKNTLLSAYLRHTQLLALLSQLSAPSGEVTEVGTGEGKTAIIATLAAIKALAGHLIDIISSADVLAQRDSIDNAPFYALFNLQANNNIDKSIDPKNADKIKACYNSNIVYADMPNLLGDYLRDTT